jgi:hypothetical protein
MFDMASGANVEMSINNVILKGLSAGHIGDPGDSGTGIKMTGASFYIDIPASTPAENNTQTLIYVGQGNTFEMLGSAELTGNYNAGDGSTDASKNGGAVRVVGGTLRMTGDYTRIHHNYAARRRGGISCIGGGKVYMTGDHAEVSYNVGEDGTGGILIAGSGYFEMLGDYAKITLNQGGAVASGGGIQLTGEGTSGVMLGANAQISDNYTRLSGGGVYVGTSVEFTMSGANAQISGNRASSLGGGVYIGTNGRFTMSSGEISGNLSISNYGHSLFNYGSAGARSYWAVGSTGYTGTHDGFGKIANTVGSTVNVDMWHEVGVSFGETFNYDAGDYGVQLAMWADK